MQTPNGTQLLLGVVDRIFEVRVKLNTTEPVSVLQGE